MAMPGLRTIFKAISKKTLREFLVEHAPDVSGRINWEAKGPDALAESVYTELSSLKSSDIETYQRVYPIFYDINELSERPKDGHYYKRKVFEIPALKKKWLEYFGVSTPDIHTLVAWIEINCTPLFMTLLKRKITNSREAKGGYKYHLPTTYGGTAKKTKESLEKFKDEIKGYLKHETGIPLRVHVECNDLPECVRYVITTDPFPKKEEQFRDGGGDDDLDMEFVKRAECFYITLFPGRTCRRSAHFSLKCDFYSTQRDYIANLFAVEVLGSRLGDKPEQKRKLDAFRSRPEAFDFSDIPDFDSYVCVGMRMNINSGGTVPEVYERRFDGDFYKAVEKRKELLDVPDESKELQELYLRIFILPGDPPKPEPDLLEGEYVHDTRQPKQYDVTVRTRGTWLAKPSPSIGDELKIDRILEAMTLRNVAGEKILKTEVRK